MSNLQLYLSLSRDEFLKYYQGTAKVVVARTTEGKIIQFPAEHLRPFVSLDGVSGLFEIQFDESFRFVSLKRLSA